MLERFALPKRYVINAGYIGAILIFVIIGGILAATLLPKLVKPVYTAPTPNLEAKVDYMDTGYPGHQWAANVSIYENSEASAHNVTVILKTPFCGDLMKKEPLMLPYDRANFDFSCTIPRGFPIGIYSVTMVIDADEAKQSNYTFGVTITEIPEIENETNNSIF